jgi:hypothetical protein
METSQFSCEMQNACDHVNAFQSIPMTDKFKSRPARLIEGGLWLLEGLTALGLVSGAVVGRPSASLCSAACWGCWRCVWARFRRRAQIVKKN